MIISEEFLSYVPVITLVKNDYSMVAIYERFKFNGIKQINKVAEQKFLYPDEVDILLFMNKVITEIEIEHR